MVHEAFNSLLQDLGKIFKIQLTPDAQGSCQVNFPTGLMLRMEVNQAMERLMIVSDLGTPAPGRYRENLFREALKANGLPQPRYGVFSYSQKKDSLVLFDSLPMDELTGQKLADFLTPFMAKALLWRTGVSKSEVPSFAGNELSFGPAAGSGMFGLK